MKNTHFWIITKCSPVKFNQYFRWTRFFHLQGWKVNQPRNQHKAGSKESCACYVSPNIGWLSPDYTAFYHRRLNSSEAPLWELQIPHSACSALARQRRLMSSCSCYFWALLPVSAENMEQIELEQAYMMAQTRQPETPLSPLVKNRPTFMYVGRTESH